MFVDTHCHLNIMVEKTRETRLTKEHMSQITAIVQEAAGAGVRKIINVGTSVVESENCVLLAQQFPFVWATVGIHPCDATASWKHEIQQIEQLVKYKAENKIVGIGETGLDFFHKPFDKQRQIDVFKAHINIALEHNLPLVVHIREAADEALRVLEEYRNDVRGVLHCFLQQPYVAETVIAWGMYLGVDAPITYPKNEWFRSLIKDIALHHLVLETDSPFLPAQNMRGKPNAPCYLPFIAETIAGIKQVTSEEVAELTTSNAEQLFGI